MTRRTRNILRLVSVIIVLALVLMELGVIPQVVNFKFWFMVVAYALVLVSVK
ncbi:MAG: hypothetical protein KI790_19400 [Cyclobacteriaceae bacterium]|nr:hypothetical protein [Cyclobacteriaceae bacterium HetDA_MAG_MS6]